MLAIASGAGRWRTVIITSFIAAAARSFHPPWCH